MKIKVLPEFFYILLFFVLWDIPISYVIVLDSSPEKQM